MPTKIIDLAERIIGGETLEPEDTADLTPEELDALASLVGEA